MIETIGPFFLNLFEGFYLVGDFQAGGIPAIKV